MCNLNQIWIDIPCPICQYSFDVQLIDIQLESVIFCHNCKTNIQLIDEAASTYSTTKMIDETLKSLNQTFKNF